MLLQFLNLHSGGIWFAFRDLRIHTKKGYIELNKKLTKMVGGLTSDCEIDLAESTTAINLYLSIIFYLLIP